MKNWIVWNRTDYLHKIDLALNNIERLICHKTQTTNHIDGLRTDFFFHNHVVWFHQDLLTHDVYFLITVHQQDGILYNSMYFFINFFILSFLNNTDITLPISNHSKLCIYVVYLCLTLYIRYLSVWHNMKLWNQQVV